MSNKKLFSIPSIGEIREFERKKPEIKSHFKVTSAGSDGNSTGGHQGRTSTASSSSTSSLSLSQSAAARNQTGAILKKHTTVTTASSVSKKRTGEASEDVQQQSLVKLRRVDDDNNKDDDERTSNRSKQFVKAGPASGSVGSETVQPLIGQGTSGISGQTSSKLATAASVVGLVPTVSAGPSKATGAAAAASNSIIVNPRQRGNPILKHVRNVPWQFGDIVPDYVMGRTVCALYLSLRYHHLNPNYIHDRLKELGHSYELRVLLVQVDVKDPHHSLKELARMAILADCTLLLSWSAEEAGRYIETYKAYENKPADSLKEKVEQDYLSRMQDCLTTVKSVKKNDVVTLLTTFGTLDKIMAASKEDLSLVPGFGSLKAQRLHNIFHEPFLKSNRTKPGNQQQEKTD